MCDMFPIGRNILVCISGISMPSRLLFKHKWTSYFVTHLLKVPYKTFFEGQLGNDDTHRDWSLIRWTKWLAWMWREGLWEMFLHIIKKHPEIKILWMFTHPHVFSDLCCYFVSWILRRRSCDTTTDHSNNSQELWSQLSLKNQKIS